MQYMSLRVARIWVKRFQAAEGRFHDRISLLVIPGGYTHFSEASNNAVVMTLLLAVRGGRAIPAIDRSHQGTTNLFEMVQIVREKGMSQISDVFRLSLVLVLIFWSTSREEISASFTRGPRLDGVEFSKGCREQRVLFHPVEKVRVPEKVTVFGDGESWKCAKTS